MKHCSVHPTASTRPPSQQAASPGHSARFLKLHSGTRWPRFRPQFHHYWPGSDLSSLDLSLLIRRMEMTAPPHRALTRWAQNGKCGAGISCCYRCVAGHQSCGPSSCPQTPARRHHGMRVMVEKAFGPAARSSALQVSHTQPAASGAALRIQRTNVSRDHSTVRGHSHYCPAVAPTLS